MKYLVLALCCVFLSLQIGVLAQDVSSTISKSQFNQILKNRNDADCPGKRFYTYEAFINAARSFKGFGTTGDINTRKREIAAFLAQTSQIVWGGAGGYCRVVEGALRTNSGLVLPARGTMDVDLSKSSGNNANYGPIGKAIGVDLLANPDLVEKDPVIAFKTAIWFWMTPKSPKPSSHNVITGRWVQSPGDKAANRVSGFGVVTNIFNSYECGKGSNEGMQNRIEFFKRYCKVLGVSPGNNLDCAKQRPFNS